MNYDEPHPSCVQPSRKSVAIPSYRVFGIPARSDARNACRWLNLMAGNANDDRKERSCLVDMNREALEKVAKALCIDTTY